MKDINLLSEQKDQKVDHDSGAFVKQLGIAFSALLLLSLVGYGMLAFIQWKLVADEVAIQKTATAYSSVITTKQDIQVKQEKINQLSGLITTVSANALINTRIMGGIAGVMPESVFIINYAVDKSGDLNISGKSKDSDNIAYFIYKLKGTGLFRDVYLSNLSANNSDNSKAGASDYNFSAVLKLKR